MARYNIPFGIKPGNYKQNPDQQIIRLIRQAPYAYFKKSQIRLLQSTRNGEISKEECLKKLVDLKNEYAGMQPKNGASVSELDKWKFSAPYSSEQLQEILSTEGALEVASDFVGTFDLAQQLTYDKFRYFHDLRESIPDFYNGLTYRDKPFGDTLSEYQNSYYRCVLDTPLSELNAAGINMSLSDFAKKVKHFHQGVEHMPEELDIVKENSKASSKMSSSSARTASFLMKSVDKAAVEIDALLLKKLVSTLESIDSNLENTQLRKELYAAQEAYQKGELEQFESTEVPREILNLLFHNESFAQATGVMLDVQRQRYTGVITKKYSTFLQSNNPSIREKYTSEYQEQLGIMKKRVIEQISSHRASHSDGYASIEEYIGEMQQYLAEVKEQETEASYDYVDSSDLIMLFEKMNHNPQNLAQVKAARENRNGAKVRIPEGDYTPEELDRLFESPTARKITDMMISTNDQMQDRVYSVLDRYPKADKMPVEYSPYEKMGEKLDYVYRQHLTEIAGEQTMQRCFPAPQKRALVFSNPKLVFGSWMHEYPFTVDKLDDIGRFGRSTSFNLFDYKSILVSYSNQNQIEMDYEKPEEKSREIKALSRKDRKKLAQEVAENRKLKQLEQELRAKLAELNKETVQH